MRTEQRLYDGDRYPSDIGITGAGTWVIPAAALGWLNRTKAPQGRRFLIEEALYLVEVRAPTE